MNPIRLLLIEDSPSDALLVESMLAGESAMVVVHAQRLADGLALLANQTFDAVLSDLGLPDSQGLATFAQLQQHAPHIPIILLTIKGDMETALSAIQHGAQDFLPKTDLNEMLLSRTIRYAIERKQLVEQLQAALAEVRTLSGMLPICTGCKKVRDDSGYWSQIETYIAKHSNASFSHGYCPECAIKTLESAGIPVSDKLRQAVQNSR